LNYAQLIFDLDGTISNPRDGIVRSLNFALLEHGFETHPETDLLIHIGPPLDKTFAELTGQNSRALIASLVSKYRERYAEVGYAENVLYRGISESLVDIHNVEGVELGVCSSKRVDFVEKILTMFDLRHLFKFVSGGEIGIEKWQQLAQLKQQGVVGDNAIMIGDRHFDLLAGHRNKLHAAGVLWGFGSRQELVREKPAHLLTTPSELQLLHTGS
jgi:phosphoglycolate phosphatase